MTNNQFKESYLSLSHRINKKTSLIYFISLSKLCSVSSENASIKAALKWSIIGCILYHLPYSLTVALFAKLCFCNTA